MSTMSLQSNRKWASQSNVATLVVLLAAAAYCVTPTARGEAAFQQVYEFPKSAPGPWHPAGRLVEGSDGYYYGTTMRGGLNDNGTVFKMTPGGALITLFSFGGTNGLSPFGGLLLADLSQPEGETVSFEV